jgi:hypothetical protein
MLLRYENNRNNVPRIQNKTKNSKEKEDDGTKHKILFYFVDACINIIVIVRQLTYKHLICASLHSTAASSTLH